MTVSEGAIQITFGWMVDDLACLHRQASQRIGCDHHPVKHTDLADFMVGRYAKDAPKDVQARMRAACGPRGGA